MYNFIYLIPIYNVQFLVNSIAKNLQTVRQTDVRYKLRGSLPINIIREAGESQQRKEKKRESLPPPYFSSVKSN